MYYGTGYSIAMRTYKAAVQILNASIGIVSNHVDLLPSLPPDIKVESLLTDFRQVKSIPYVKGLDGHISVQDGELPPSYQVQKDRFVFHGPFRRFEKQASDVRYSLWGNQGFLYRYALYLLEKRHHTYSLHACALYNEEKDILYVIIGGAGSGKTVYLLSGLEKGLKLFSTETVHFHIREASEINWYMGSLVDNIRFGTLVCDFPGFLPRVKIPSPNELWQKKIAIDLSKHKTTQETLKNPQNIHILFPHIEHGIEKTVWNPIQDKRKAVKNLFDNITQKLAETILLYDHLAVRGLDEAKLAQGRLEATRHLIDNDSISQIATLLSNPRDCWSQLL